MDRALRLSHLQDLLYRKRSGYRAADLARLCGTSKRTIERDLADLQGDPFYLPLIQEGDWRWRLTDEHRFTLPPIQLSLQQAAALYLAARLLDKVSDEPNPFVSQALVALAGVLPPEIGQQVQEMATLRMADATTAFAQVFQVITLGWATGRKVRIRYRSAHSDNVHDYVLSPYLIEPSTVGYAAYVIGHATYFDEVRTFKLERIQEAELLDEEFQAPEDFHGHEMLSSAWGVMFGEESQEVVLRFSPRVARRVGETTWHAGQQLEACDDGGCIMRVEVANTLEMKHWIRGWGPDCVVLEPEELRREIADEMRRAAEGYTTASEKG